MKMPGYTRNSSSGTRGDLPRSSWTGCSRTTAAQRCRDEAPTLWYTVATAWQHTQDFNTTDYSAHMAHDFRAQVDEKMWRAASNTRPRTPKQYRMHKRGTRHRSCIQRRHLIRDTPQRSTYGYATRKPHFEPPSMTLGRRSHAPPAGSRIAGPARTKTAASRRSSSRRHAAASSTRTRRAGNTCAAFTLTGSNSVVRGWRATGRAGTTQGATDQGGRGPLGGGLRAKRPGGRHSNVSHQVRGSCSDLSCAAAIGELTVTSNSPPGGVGVGRGCAVDE